MKPDSNLNDAELYPTNDGLVVSKGAELGRFYLGSSIVLIFEAPDDFEFTVKAGQKIKVGQTLGDSKWILDRLKNQRLNDSSNANGSRDVRMKQDDIDEDSMTFFEKLNDIRSQDKKM